MTKHERFASGAWKRKGKLTRRNRFPAEIDRGISWGRSIERSEPHCYAPSGKGPGRKPHDLEFVVRSVRDRMNRRAPGGEENLGWRWREINRARCR